MFLLQFLLIIISVICYCISVLISFQALEQRKAKEKLKNAQRHAKSMPDLRKEDRRGREPEKRKRDETTVRKKKGNTNGETYYAAYKDGKWQRVYPEDIADNYLRALSLPPDIGNYSHSKIGNLYETKKRRKFHSALPALSPGVKGKKAREPQWVRSLARMAKEERLQPALVGKVSKRKGKLLTVR
jgi:hypothetical protein